MDLNLDSLSLAAKIALLARLASELTICARDTYDVGTENVLHPQKLRAYNELLHRVTGSVVSHLTGEKGYSLGTIVEMVREFGAHHKQPQTMDSALERAFQSATKEPMA
jgi:hypothetical protein